MLKDALKTLSAAPTTQERKQALADVNAQITMLESQLGIKARLMPIFGTRAVARLVELEKLVAAKGLTPIPAAAALAAAIQSAPVAVTTPAAMGPVEKTGSATIDQLILASGCHGLDQYRAKLKTDQAFAAVASTVPGTLSRICAESKLSAAQSALARFN